MNIGEACWKYRTDVLKISRKDFSKNTGLTVSQIRHFEQGRSRNMEILLAYDRAGFDVKAFAVNSSK